MFPSVRYMPPSPSRALSLTGTVQEVLRVGCAILVLLLLCFSDVLDKERGTVHQLSLKSVDAVEVFARTQVPAQSDP